MNKLTISIGLIFSFIIFSFIVTQPIQADEPAEAFLEALRENGYYDLAIDYLDGLEKSDLISDDFRKILPFEKAETLISSTANLRDIDKLESRLDKAQALLTEYAGRDTSTETLARTLRYQGNLYYRRSKVYTLKSSSDRLTANEKEGFATKAREMLNGSLESYRGARTKVRSLIDPESDDAIRIDVEDPSTTAKLKQYQNIYTQIRFRLPMVIEQLADTYPAQNPESVKLFEEAVNEYSDVYNDYRRYPAGLDSCVYAARCNQKLGKHKAAVDGLADIFELSDSSTFKTLKRKAFMIATESWNKIEPYPSNEVVARLTPVVEVLNRTEVRHPDWLRIQMELAIAQYKQSDVVKAKGGPKANGDAKALVRSAGRMMRNVSRVPSIHRDQAKQLLSDWNIPVSDLADAAETTIESFMDARLKGKDLVAEIESLLNERSDVRKKLAGADPTPELLDIEKRIGEQAKATLAVLEIALELADESTIRTDINNIRYLQSYCYFAQEQYYESALIGEFLLAKYPTVDGTRQTMNLMIQSYAQLYDLADPTDRAFELEKLTTNCSAVVDRWPGSNEAGSAASRLTRLAIARKDFDKAEQYFAQIPANAAIRASLGANLGQRIWFDYKAKLKTTTDRESLAPQLKKALEHLESGVEFASTDSLRYDQALAALLLVDALLESGQTAKAIERLESAAIAPLDLVKQKHPAITNVPMEGIYKRETYNIAIKSYLAAMSEGDHQKWLDKANGVIDAMRGELEASNDPNDRKHVTAIYLRIAAELKSQFDSLDSAEEKKSFAPGLSSMLGSIEKDSENATIILKAGATLLSTAESLKELNLDSDAKPLFQQAVSALNRAETLGFAGDKNEKLMVLELKRQRALAQRGSGNFEVAMKQFIELLKENPMSLKDQVLAAETLQHSGKSASRAKGFAEAMMGMEKFKDPKTKRETNLIWGWRKLVQATRSNPKFAETYYKSLYNLALCRFEYGVISKSDKAIKSALQEINNAAKRDPKLGGAEWKLKFDQLKLRISQQ